MRWCVNVASPVAAPNKPICQASGIEFVVGRFAGSRPTRSTSNQRLSNTQSISSGAPMQSRTPRRPPILQARKRAANAPTPGPSRCQPIASVSQTAPSQSNAPVAATTRSVGPARRNAAATNHGHPGE